MSHPEFQLSAGELVQLFDGDEKQRKKILDHLGGLSAVISGLHTNLQTGIDSASRDSRLKSFGENIFLNKTDNTSGDFLPLRDRNVSVIRDGNEKELSIFDLVVGDIVVLKENDVVPADGILVKTKEGLHMDESPMTGEASAVFKDANAPFLLSGTFVRSGNGKLLVLCVGARSLVGKMLRRLKPVPRIKRVLSKNKQLPVDSIVVRTADYFQFKQQFEEKKRAHLLSSVRNIITYNNPTVQRVYFFRDNQPKIEEAKQIDGSSFHPSFTSLLNESISINSKAFIDKGRIGDRLECALLEFITSTFNADYETLRADANYQNLETFSKKSRLTKTLIQTPASRSGSKKYTLHIKGAPDVVLPLCTRVNTGEGSQNIDEQKRKDIQSAITSFESNQLMTVAVAFAELDAATSDSKDMELLAVFGLRDPIREDSPEAFSRALSSGFQVHLITGSSLTYAASVGKSLGLAVSNDEAAEEAAFLESLKKDPAADFGNYKLLAKASVDSSVALMERLQSKGELVVVVGSSIADASELMTNADLSLALGSAPDVVKEAADAIVLDDCFSSVVRAAIGIKTQESCKVQ